MESTENDVKPTEEKPPREFSSPWHFSDVVLVVEGTKFHVHRSTLSIWSPVFEKMFSSDFKEKTAKEIPLPEKSADEMEVLLKVIYSSDANQKITEKNHEFLLELAREYQMEKIKQYCYQYMQGSISEYNCLHRCKVADRFGFKDIIGRCKVLACLKYSTELERSADFRDLELELKFEICMARIKELEKKPIERYVEICSKLLSSYYDKLEKQVPKDYHCNSNTSHGFKKGGKKRFDSSCTKCRNRMMSFCDHYVLPVNATDFDFSFQRLYDLVEHDKKVAE